MSLYSRIVEKNFEKFKIRSGAFILDVGCGNGDFVHYLRELDYSCFGIDLEFKEGTHIEELQNIKAVRKIKVGSKNRRTLDTGDFYEWPEFSNQFDVVLSKAVLEHIQNLDEFVEQTIAALRPDQGLCLHYYPSKFAIIEPHTGVPFGGWILNLRWFKFMCFIGACFHEYRRNGDAAFSYMKQFTCYRTQTEIDRVFAAYGFAGVLALGPLTCHPSRVLRFLGRSKLICVFFNLFRSRVVAYRLKSEKM